MKEKLEHSDVKISLKWVMLIVLFIISASLFIFIASTIVLQNDYRYDMAVIRYVIAHETMSLIHFMMVFTFFGSAQFLLPAYILLILFYLIKKNKTYAIYIAVVGIGSTALMFLLKNIFQRHRPPMPVIKTIVGYSFPSGHSLSSFVFCSLIAYLIFQTTLKTPLKFIIAFILMIISFTIGLSRIILNVHYASDVIGGFCLGFMLLVISLGIIKRQRKSFCNTA